MKQLKEKPIKQRSTDGRKSLNYLNLEHDFPVRSLNKVVSKGILGRLRSFFIRLLGLDGYLHAQSSYQANLVRCLNELSSDIEWLQESSNDDLKTSFYSLEKKTFDKLDQHIFSETDSRSSLNKDVVALSIRTETLESVVRGLERIVSLLGQGVPLEKSNNPKETTKASPSRAASPEINDYRYLLLENRYRGSEELIRKRVAVYPSLFEGRGIEQAVLEVGAGRGELQEVFKEAGIRSYGVDLDPAMVSLCQNKGLDVRHQNALEHMQNLADDSLDGVIALQVVEHLKVQQLESFLSLCRSKIVPGGRLVLETINTKSLVALSQNYFRDPTHAAPVHPDTLREMVEQAGLNVVDLRYLSPFPSGALLKLLPQESFYPQNYKALIDVLNNNIEQLNELLYTYQDYCVIAEVAGD